MVAPSAAVMATVVYELYPSLRRAQVWGLGEAGETSTGEYSLLVGSGSTPMYSE
jgi:hypothetical protein